MVHTNEEGYMSVAYDKMPAVLVKAVKELNEKLEAKTKINEELKPSADQLKLENAEIKMELEKMDLLEVRLAELERLIGKG